MVEYKIPIRIIKTKNMPAKSFWRGAKQTLLKRACYSGSAVVLICMLALQALPMGAFEAHVINVTAKICRQSETRTMGYWKNHEEVYDPDLLPQTLGGIGSEDLSIDNQTEVNKVFDDYNLSMRNKLRGQLLAMKFNIAEFGIGGFEYFVYGLGTTTMDNLVAEADGLLSTSPPPPNSVLENIKNALDTINNLHQIRFCSTGGGGGQHEPEKIVINKVYYDVDAKHGCEPANEWVELYNPNDEPIDIQGWAIMDNMSSDTLATTLPSLLIPALGYAIITGSSTTWKYWQIPPDVIKIVLADGIIGNALANDKDMVALKDADGNIIDQMNWGKPSHSWPNYNDELWNPGLIDIPEGRMYGRFPIGYDTDTVSDWMSFATPSVKVIIPNGGEVWHVGRTYELTWTATNPNGTDDELKIDLYFSGDSGKTWGVIAASTENDGSYNWRIPLFLSDGYYVVSHHARIRAVATGPENFMAQGWDMSDRDFCPPVDYAGLSEDEKITLEQLLADGIIMPSEIINEELPSIETNSSEALLEQPAIENATSTIEIATSTADANIPEELPADNSIADTGNGGGSALPLVIEPAVSEPQPTPDASQQNLEPTNSENMTEAQNPTVENQPAPSSEASESIVTDAEQPTDNATQVSSDNQPAIEPPPVIEPPPAVAQDSPDPGADTTSQTTSGDGGQGDTTSAPAEAPLASE